MTVYAVASRDPLDVAFAEQQGTELTTVGFHYELNIGAQDRRVGVRYNDFMLCHGYSKFCIDMVLIFIENTNLVKFIFKQD